MPPFETPSPPFHSSQLRTWFENVEPQMQYPELLWGDYWKRFNTIQIPIVGESDYFNNAIRVAKLAGGRKADFERISEEENKQQREKLLSLLARAANQTIYNDKMFPCRDARDRVFDVCQTGYLMNFLRLLKGNAFGWEADAAEDVQLGGNLSEETQALADQTQDPLEENNPHDETQWPDDDYCYETPIERQAREEQSANATYYIGTYTYTQYTTPMPNSTGMPESDISILEKETEEKEALPKYKKRKRDRFDYDAADARSYRQELLSIMPGSMPCTSTQQAIDGSATNDNSTLDDDNDNGYGHALKRRKLKRPFALKPTSIDPSYQLPTDKGTFKKRSRSNDCDDYEHSHKR